MAGTGHGADGAAAAFGVIGEHVEADWPRHILADCLPGTIDAATVADEAAAAAHAAVGLVHSLFQSQRQVDLPEVTGPAFHQFDGVVVTRFNPVVIEPHFRGVDGGGYERLSGFPALQEIIDRPGGLASLSDGGGGKTGRQHVAAGENTWGGSLKNRRSPHPAGLVGEAFDA